MNEQEIKAELATLASRKKELEAALDGLRMDRAGVRPGDITLDKDGAEVRVTRVGALWSEREKPWVYGNYRKKNGGWSKAERCLYRDWTAKT